jgi:hypothetical protein
VTVDPDDECGDEPGLPQEREEDEAEGPATGWLGAVGQLAAAVLVVVVIVALFIAGSVALRWLLR